MRAALERVPKRARKGDLVVIFLAGHGAPVGRGNEWAFIPHDFDPDAAAQTIVHGDCLLRAIDGLAYRGFDVLLAVESCHSGLLASRARELKLFGANAFDPARGTALVVASSGPKQLSLASNLGDLLKGEGETGWFGAALRDALVKGDENGDGVVTAKEFRTHLKTRLLSISESRAHLPGLRAAQKCASIGFDAAEELGLDRASPGAAKHWIIRVVVQ